MAQSTLSGDKPWKDPENLRRLYHDEGLNQTEIAEKWGTSAATISNWMGKFEIDTTHTKHDSEPDVQGPEFCTRCEENRTPGGSATPNMICDECLDESRANGPGHDL